MSRIAISYRREDSAEYAGRIADRLRAGFGAGNVAIDFDEVHLGEDVVEAIEQVVGGADFLIAVIGPTWASAGDGSGNTHLGNDMDHVRLEIQTALEHKTRMIPVLVGGAAMPGTGDLPSELAAMVRKQPLNLGDGTFDADLDQLVAAVERIVPASTTAPSPQAAEPDATTIIKASSTQVITPPKTKVVAPASIQDAGATRVMTPPDDHATVVLKDPKAFDWANVDLTDLTSHAWIAVPGGRFTMGSNQGADQEKPPHKVTVSDFVMSRFPITNEQWARFMESTGYQPPKHWEGRRIPDGKERHPVVHVSWLDANAYCDWLSLEVQSSAPGRVRLATEAEREFVVRGTDDRKYPWGKDEPTPRHANFGDTVKDTTPVDAYPLGTTPDTGLYDLAGNIWEWCGDWWDKFTAQAEVDPTGPVNGSSRVLKGGSYFDSARYLRASARPGSGPDARLGFYGFRVVWSESDQGATRVLDVRGG